MMDPTKRELLDLVIRWVHVIAGIMWVGNSMLFNWLDRNLVKRQNKHEDKDKNDRHVGEIWMVHSGGFYEVEKKFLAPGEMPEMLHWFKWQSYTTWVTGFLLLGVVYYMGGASNLIDVSTSTLTPTSAMFLGLGILGGGFLSYDLLWRSPLRKYETFSRMLTLGIIGGAMSVAFHYFTGRAAYIHVGAMLGTLMAGNVFFHIIPSQHELINATTAGRAQDPSFSDRAKQRSIHNNYFTFPLLFIMVSNHYASMFGNKHPALVLAVIMLTGALVRHFMNIRFTFSGWLGGLLGSVVVGLLAILLLTRQAPQAVREVSFNEVYATIQTRCVPCHATKPSDPTLGAAPKGMVFESPEQIKQHAAAIYTQAVVSRAMPQGNKTRITEDERQAIGAWFTRGATVGP
ncbi:MAG: urate hydroxylase PuuD [Polyangiaceae bacterium]|nr:urate hydroxylase PuuD [Polyangiaceae bacterium]